MSEKFPNKKQEAAQTSPETSSLEEIIPEKGYKKILLTEEAQMTKMSHDKYELQNVLKEAGLGAEFSVDPHEIIGRNYRFTSELFGSCYVLTGVIRDIAVSISNETRLTLFVSNATFRERPLKGIEYNSSDGWKAIIDERTEDIKPNFFCGKLELYHSMP